MRRMSFSATVQPMRDQTKTVTRRHPRTWRDLKPGDQLMAVEKAMGLPKGATQVAIGVIEIVSNNVEPLDRCDEADAIKEGFDSLADFLRAWRRLHGSIDPDALVRRIAFRHLCPADLTDLATLDGDAP